MKRVCMVMGLLSATAQAQVQMFLPLDKEVAISAYVDNESAHDVIATASGFTDETCVDWSSANATYCYGTTYDNHEGTDYDIPNELTGGKPNPNYVPFTVYSAEKGTVVKVSFGEKGYGNHVIIQHAGNIQTLYGHLKEVWVDEGQEVAVHAELGIAGTTGNSTGEHLHFEVRKVQNGVTTIIDPYHKNHKHLWCNGTPKVYKGVPCKSAVTWHPPGTLVSPQNAGGEIVYIVDSNGVTITPIVDDAAGTFAKMRFDWKKVVYVSDSEMNCFAEKSEKLSVTPFGFFVYESWFGLIEKRYFYYGHPQDSTRYKIEIEKGVWELVVKSWGFEGIPTLDKEAVKNLHETYPKVSGYAFVREGTLLKNEDAVYYIVSGTQAHLIPQDVLVKAGYQLGNALAIDQEKISDVVSHIGDMYTESTFATCGAQMCAAVQQPNFLSVCTVVAEVDSDLDGSPAGKDCNDTNPTQSPKHQEVCGDGLDNDCDGKKDEENCESGFEEVVSCAIEVNCLTAFDDNCNGTHNEMGGKNCTYWYRDNDNDGCSDGKVKVCLCEGNAEYKVDEQNCLSDCDDSDSSMAPFNVEKCGDQKDNNCNGVIDENCGECVGKWGEPCDDGNTCTINDVCGIAMCAGKPLLCDDGNFCTNDSCDVQVGCVYQVVYKPCNDNNACSTQDVCNGGICNGVAKSCNDGNPCTADFCNAQIGCHYEHAFVTCDDGNSCTIDDFCEKGGCKGVDVCDCKTSQDCKDGNECTYDACAQGVCTHEASIGSCESDNDACTQDACSNGMCTHTVTTVCNDGNPCTHDECTDTGCMFALANQTSCDDGDPCTANDVCMQGMCKGFAVCGETITKSVVKNGSFEMGNTDWVQEIHDWESASMKVLCYEGFEGNCRVDFFNALFQDYKVQMWQQIPIHAGKKYQFSVYVHPDLDSFSVRLWVGKQSEPYTVYHQSGECVLSKGMWQKCETSFTAAQTDTQAKFAIVLGNLMGIAYLDLVEIVETGD